MIHRKSLSAIPLLLLAHLCGAEEDTEIPGPAICASQEALECKPLEGCTRVSVEDIDGPLFLSLKPGEPRILVTLTNGRHETTTVERREKVGGSFVFQGAETEEPEGEEQDEHAVGWTMMISEEDGRMTLTASGEDVGFVIFGACTLL